MVEFVNPLDAKPWVKDPSPMKTYDELNAPYVDVGCSYGKGYKNPVGSKGSPKANVPSLPYGRLAKYE